MAKEWKSLWDDHDDEPEKTKKSSGRSSEKWYYSDGRDNDDEDEKDRTIIGFDTRYTEDDKSSDDYGGYGYSGYSYYDSFDDSSSDWYRRGSFRYSRQADYSPSSQFRSTFSRYSYSYSSGGGDEAKNKAIRALRNLTRSANTIVDKAVGNRQSFAVQFSDGTDSNGFTAELTEEKQRVVFVSPDDLLATTTTEEEDSVIDALTGFVLLRVQIAQDTTPDIVRRINATGLYTAGFRAAESLFLNKDKLEGISPAAFSQEVTDEYLAGLLAKGMLTRLARRNVVSNWGGFGPYFIRHAKKFATVRENLLVAEKSVETIVGILGYNMLADESQIELPEDINTIASKHLGAEVETGKLLDVCRALVAEIREFMTKNSEDGKVPAGMVEAALEEMMAKAQAEQSRASPGQEALRELLSKAGGAMGDAHDCGKACGEMHDENSAKNSEIANELKKAVSVEQLIKQLEKMYAEMDRVKKFLDESKNTEAAVHAQSIKNNLAYTATSRPQAVELLKDAGVKEVDELLRDLHKTSDFKTETREKLERLEALLKAVTEKAGEVLKNRRKDLKTKASEAVENMVNSLMSAKEHLDKAEKRVTDTAEDLRAKPSVPGAESEQAINAMLNLANILQEVRRQVENGLAKLPEPQADINGSRALKTLQKAFAAAQNATYAALSGHNSCFSDNYGLRTSPNMAKLSHELREMLSDHPAEPTEANVKSAVERTLSASSVTDMNFMSSLVNGFTRDELAKLMGQDPADLAKEAQRLGISKETLSKIVQALQNATNSSKVSATANAIGKEAAEKLEKIQASFSPVDRHLFGDKIEAATTVLTGEAIGHVNEESRHAAEEDYVAYLDHNDCKPVVHTRHEEVSRYGSEARNTVVRTIKTTNKSAIERIRNALQFQSGRRTVETHGLRSGDLDEGSLHKLSYDCEHIWSQKTISKLPDVAVGILVDQSGSMSGPKIDQAREICITLAEAIRKIAGVRLYVYGHTANMGHNNDVVIYEHYTPAMGPDMTRLGGIAAHCNNYDGYAIKDVAKRLSADEAKKKYLFVIADGFPAGAGYGGQSAQQHVTSVCKFSRDRLKIGTYAFAVGVHGHHREVFKKQYGENHVVFVDNVKKCLPQIVRFLRNAMQQERKLVGIEDK